MKDGRLGWQCWCYKCLREDGDMKTGASFKNGKKSD
jgi:hypothetical protein